MDGAAGAGVSPTSLVRAAKDALLEYPLTSEDAHTVCIEVFTSLLTRLQAATECKLSAKKRVAVKGALFHPGAPGIKFTADYNKGELTKIRLQTLGDEADKSAVPSEFGGTGLMAPASTDDEATRSEFPSKAKRSRSTPTLHDTLEKALALASENADAEIIAAIESLLKRV